MNICSHQNLLLATLIRLSHDLDVRTRAVRGDWRSKVRLIQVGRTRAPGTVVPDFGGYSPDLIRKVLKEMFALQIN